MTTDLPGHIAGLRLVDNHVHGFWTSPVDRSTFEHGLNEANTDPLAGFDSGFDSQVGFAVRAHCAPLLGLPRHTQPDVYWEQRTRYSPMELATTFLSEAGVSDWLVDTGTAGVAGLDEIHAAAQNAVHEIVRLEQVAEQAVAAGGDYPATFVDMLHARAATAVATKTVLAYRGGFDRDLSEPTAAKVAECAARWRDTGDTRLTDPTLLSFGIHQALRLGKPLQFHVGFGDRDCDLHRTNPLLLLEFLRTCGDTPIVLLHCYPYEREAGYLARAFNHLYIDTGLHPQRRSTLCRQTPRTPPIVAGLGHELLLSGHPRRLPALGNFSTDLCGEVRPTTGRESPGGMFLSRDLGDLSTGSRPLIGVIDGNRRVAEVTRELDLHENLGSRTSRS